MNTRENNNKNSCPSPWGSRRDDERVTHPATVQLGTVFGCIIAFANLLCSHHGIKPASKLKLGRFYYLQWLKLSFSNLGLQADLKASAWHHFNSPELVGVSENFTQFQQKCTGPQKCSAVALLCMSEASVYTQFGHSPVSQAAAEVHHPAWSPAGALNVLASTGVCSRALPMCGSLHSGKTVDHQPLASPPVAASLSLCLFSQAVQQVKACSNTPPTAGLDVWACTGGGAEDQRGGKPRKDPAWLSLLRSVSIAFSLSTLTHELVFEGALWLILCDMLKSFKSEAEMRRCSNGWRLLKMC